MAQVVMAAQAADAVTNSVVGIADAAAHIEDVVRDEAAKNKEAMRQSENEFNIRKNFLDNAVDAIQKKTLSQFNIVICTDQSRDDFQDLQGRILPMSLLNLEISPGKFVDFEVYVFDTGKYLRHGKYERDHWWYWGETKKFYDPFAMHVHFEKAQPKLNPEEVKKQQEENAAKAKAAADVTATVEGGNASGATQLGAAAKEQPADPSDTAAAAPVSTTSVSGPAPSFTQHMLSVMTVPMMKMAMG